jgi:ABC-2 family transporter protein
MTALSTPARRDEDDARLRPVPWRRMAGVTWRQHRTALIAVAVLLGALAVYLWIAGTSLHNAYNAAVSCHPESSAACQGLDNTVSGMDNFLSNGYILQVLPVLIGAFVGAPVLARELETGTFRFAWTQGFGRRRWAVAKLVLLAVAVTAAAGAFGALLTWYYQPFLSDHQFLGLPRTTPFAPGVFDLRGVGFPAWTLAAFSIGVLAGMLIRRVVPAIATTLVVYVGLAFAAAGFLRERYRAPLVISGLNSSVPSNAWVVSTWWTKDGRVAFGDYPPANILNQYCPPTSAGKGGGPSEGWGPCLVQHGYTMWTSYQPTSRFWPFQWIEGGWLLALSVLLIAAAIWLVQRRAA